MNIVFFASSEFAKLCLEALIDKGENLSLVVTQPDKRQGRGLLVASTVIKKTAIAHGLKVFQPESINTPESLSMLRSCRPDLFIIIAYGQKFSQEALDIPSIMPLNIHASLLPKYRGAAPINWAIINGDRQTGNTLMKVTPSMDSGPIILQSSIRIADDDTATTIEERLSSDAVSLLFQGLEQIMRKTVTLTDQDKTQVSFAPKLNPQVARIDWNQTARNIHNLVRGCLNWSAAYTFLGGKLLKIYKTHIDSETNHTSGVSPGEVVNISKKSIFVSTKDGIVCIDELQLEGKKRLAAAEFASGARLKTGDSLGAR